MIDTIFFYWGEPEPLNRFFAEYELEPHNHRVNGYRQLHRRTMPLAAFMMLKLTFSADFAIMFAEEVK